MTDIYKAQGKLKVGYTSEFVFLVAQAEDEPDRIIFPLEVEAVRDLLEMLQWGIEMSLGAKEFPEWMMTEGNA